MDHRIERKNNYVPLLTLVTYISLLVSAYLNNFHNNWANQYLQCKFEPIFKNYQVWRMVINVFNQPSLTALCCILLISYSFFSKFERKNGTVTIFTLILVYNFLFNVAFIGGMLAGYLIYTYALQKAFNFQITTGLFCIWINMLYKFFHFNRNSQLTCLGIPTRLIPILIIGFVTLVDQQIRYDGFFGLIVAILECLFFRGGLISFTKETYTDKQWVADKIWLSKLCCWCKLHPQNITLSELCVVDEFQFYQNLDPQILTPFEEYNVDSERMYGNTQSNGMEMVKDDEEAE